MKSLQFFLAFSCLMALSISCRPTQESTQYTVTQGELKDGELIDDGSNTSTDSEVDGDDQGNSDDKSKYYGEEVFTQGEEAQVTTVDILWVIDNSGSMKDEQENLQNNFDSFINNFIKEGKAQYPFKMGVTTTEAYQSGETFFQGFGCNGSFDKFCQQYDLTSEAAENNFQLFSENFKSAVGVGTSGSGNEKSLYSASAIYDKFPSWFAGNDTLTVIIPVSDEQEQSHLTDSNRAEPLKSTPLLDENGNQYTIEKWASEFQARKDNPSKIRFYPIVRLNEIKGEFGDGDVDERYKKIADLTGGKRSDIDKPFDDILNGIGNAIVNLLNSFLLKGDREIIEGTIKVYVNDVLNNNWTYQSFAIKFNTPPTEGSTIKVTYEYNKKK